MADKVPLEHIEQVTFVSQFRQAYPGVLIFAIPNGGYRDKRTAEKLKAEGVVSGVPDLFIPAWRLWIEMKRQKGGGLSAEQKVIIPQLEADYTVIVGKGWKDAMEKVRLFRAG